MTDEAGGLSPEEIDQVIAVIDVCLEEGYDIDGVEPAVLKRTREKLKGGK